MPATTLGEFELLVLLAILRLGEHAYAVSITEEIEQRTERKVQRASVYVTVQRLERKGLVSSWLGAPLAERGGKARRHVKVEDAGLAVLRQTTHSLTRMWGGLESTLGLES